jgi:phage gp45-like
MQRATPVDSSIRGYGAGGARGLVHEADDSQYMQEVKVNYMKYETRKKVEHPQNYGFSSYCRKAEYGSDDSGDKPDSGTPEKPIKSSAEHFGQFMGGNRAFPVIEVLDDRRYRLFNNQEGEVWVYDDQQQKVQIKRNLILTRSQFKIVHRIIKDEQQADKKKTRDQSKQDIDDAKQDGQGQQQQSGGGGQSSSDNGVEQSGTQDKPWKPLSSYAADKDSIVLVRQQDNDDGDLLSKLWLTDGEGDATPKGEKQKPKGPLLEGKFDEKKQTISFTVYYQPDSEQQKPRLVFTQDGEDDYLEMQTLDQEGNLTLWFRMDQQGKMITLQTLDQGTPKQTIQLDNNKQQIHSFTKSTDVILDENKKKVLVGDQSANTPAAMRGSIDSKGHRIIAHVCPKVLLPEGSGGGGSGGNSGSPPTSAPPPSTGTGSGGSGSGGVIEA